MTHDEAQRFSSWLLDQVVADARGDRLIDLPNAPRGRFWLGRLAPEEVVRKSRYGERGERLEPCEIGVRVRPTTRDQRKLRCQAQVVAWTEQPSVAPGKATWKKLGPANATVELTAPDAPGAVVPGGAKELEAALAAIGAAGLSAEVHAEIEEGKSGPELVVTLVNTSPEKVQGLETNLYEARLAVDVGETVPFVLDELPDSFRYDRTVDAYGVNGGVRRIATTTFETTDLVRQDRYRPEFWDTASLGPEPDLSFRTLAQDPIPGLRMLLAALRTWGQRFWGNRELERRAREERWSGEMVRYASSEAAIFTKEVERIERGVRLLEDQAVARRAFVLMNRVFDEAVGIVHDRWRPFQLGFILANLPAICPGSSDADRTPVDTLWFPTGGGKTETYLGLSVTAAFADRLRGKRYGITAWARFPLRMLSLQQTQRFADVLAAAEVVRRAEAIEGETFSVGFLVGEPGTPNEIRVDHGPGQPDPNDPAMPRQYRILLRCPFCGSEDIEMRFDKKRWTLDHHCRSKVCPWKGPLPFRIVDKEIFRYLPTFVVGTLDKAASIALQAAMRGFYGAPLGRCSQPEHGFTYARRYSTPNGCLVPGCTAGPAPLGQDQRLFPPLLRIQDELHLLRDSLGAVDAHYESLLDHLQAQAGEQSKIVASSATIAGYEDQVEVLYRPRHGQLFPLPGPRAGQSFWAVDTTQLARIFAGLAPRGVTIDYAADRANEALQSAVRYALADPVRVSSEIGISETSIADLVSFYGVDVVYGSTLRDVEAAARSFEGQISIPVNAITLVGRTPLEEVRDHLARLTNPEPDFDERIHLVAASSMLSHGVDLDRLNVMVMLGIPLSTAEFIQATSRVGRRYPAIVLVLHKIGRERDAKVFRTFGQFVAHADRLIDPVPITRRSRRVLELTFAGLFMGRLYGVHEPAALAKGLNPLTTPKSLRRAFQSLPVLEEDEYHAIESLLGITEALDEGMRTDLRAYVREVFRAANDPATPAKFATDLLPEQPMRSLRDVEEEVPVFSRGGPS